MESRKLVERTTRWFLRTQAQPIDIANAIERFAPKVAVLSGRMMDVLPEAGRRSGVQSIRQSLGAGVPDALAAHVAVFDELVSALDIVDVAERVGMTVEDVAGVYFNLDATLELGWLRDEILASAKDKSLANAWLGRRCVMTCTRSRRFLPKRCCWPIKAPRTRPRASTPGSGVTRRLCLGHAK